MRIPNVVARDIVARLLRGEDYRPAIVELIDAEFLSYAIEFFKRVATAKIEGAKITEDWYRAAMLDAQLPKEQIAANAGLNIKTIENARHTTRKEVVLEESLKHYDKLRQIIDELTQGETSFGVEISITFREVSVKLDLAESLLVVNALAVARAAIRGGAWSTAGKQVEKPLMTALCALHRVPVMYFDQSRAPTSARETDFYLFDKQGKPHRCEVKLLGKGNPESADAPLAREAAIFVADTISETMKQQLTQAGILWVELREAQDWRQFAEVLEYLGIPHQPVPEAKAAEWLAKCLDVVFSAEKINDEVRERGELYHTDRTLLVELE